MQNIRLKASKNMSNSTYKTLSNETQKLIDCTEAKGFGVSIITNFKVVRIGGREVRLNEVIA